MEAALTKLVYRLIVKLGMNNQKYSYESLKYLKKFKENPKLVKKLNLYEGLGLLFSVIVFVIYSILFLIIGLPLIPDETSLRSIVLAVSIIFNVIFSLAPIYYLTNYLELLAFRIFDPGLDVNLIKNYQFDMLNERGYHTAESLKINKIEVDKTISR